MSFRRSNKIDQFYPEFCCLILFRFCISSREKSWNWITEQKNAKPNQQQSYILPLSVLIFMPVKADDIHTSATKTNLLGFASSFYFVFEGKRVRERASRTTSTSNKKKTNQERWRHKKQRERRTFFVQQEKQKLWHILHSHTFLHSFSWQSNQVLIEYVYTSVCVATAISKLFLQVFCVWLYFFMHLKIECWKKMPFFLLVSLSFSLSFCLSVCFLLLALIRCAINNHSSETASSYSIEFGRLLSVIQFLDHFCSLYVDVVNA